MSLINAFTPAPGDSFTIMTYASHTGGFSTSGLPSLAGCVGWTVRYDATGAVLSVVSIPVEIGGQAIAPDKTTLRWDPAPSHTGTVYDVLRGQLGKLPVGSQPATETCVISGLANTQTPDATTPLPSKGFWYLVRERVTGCPVGTYGFSSSSVERITSTPCP